jgi:predicted flap endonuclease-1-like 5' DNA nuclease
MSVALVTLLSLAILIVGFLAGWLVGGIGSTLEVIALLSMLTMGIGFLVGWLVEWILDNQYRRMRELGQASGPVVLPTAGAAPPTDITELAQMLKGVLSEREEEVGELRGDLAHKEQAYEQLREQFDQYAATHPDDLTVIKGIGRIYQWKLRDAGYSTYAQLADADPDALRQLLDVKPWQKSDPQSWIDQSKALIQRREHRQEE